MSKNSTIPAQKLKTTLSTGADVTKKITDRQNREIVIGLCGYIGSGVSTVGNALNTLLKNTYKYSPYYIKLSHIIEDLSHIKTPKDIGNKIESLQKHGNMLREEHGPAILAQHAVMKIYVNRKTREGKKAPQRNHSERCVTIIDSIKNPSEVSLLKAVYGDLFYLIGVLCPEDIRISRLHLNKKIKKSDASAIVERDRKEEDNFGQRTSEALAASDFFIANTRNNVASIKPDLNRFASIILGTEVQTPTIAEFAMFCAQASATRSACISRQVGAAIANKDGEIIALGRNDVPRSGGGLYCPEDKENDNRCVFRYGGKCKNTEYKDEIKEELYASIFEELNDQQKSKSIAESILKIDKIKSITEFSRSIHAEMDAITTIARNGNSSLKGSTLFCTTFPCHNCARHIVASGIEQVFYIEPYDKSLADQLHDDTICVDRPEGEGHGKLRINQFEGVAPSKFLRLFKRGDQKRIDGTLESPNPEEAAPVIRKLLDKVDEYEETVIQDLTDKGFITDNGAPAQP